MRFIFIFCLIISSSYSKIYSLLEVFELSNINSDEKKISKYQYESAQEELEKSISPFYPKIDLKFEYKKVNEFPIIVDGIEIDKRNEKLDSTLNIEQVLYDRKKYVDYKQKKNSLKKSFLEKRNNDQMLIHEVINSYFETIFKKKQKELIEQKIKHTNKIIQKASSKYKTGLISKADYLESKASGIELVAQRIQNELDLNLSKSILLRLTGLNSINIKNNIKFFNLEDIEYSKEISNFNNNFNIKLQEFLIKEAKLNKSESITGFEPKLSLNYEYLRDDVKGTDDQKKLSLILNIPIFSGFYDLDNYQQKKIEELIQKSRQDQIIKETKQNINNKIKNIKSYIEIINTYPQIIESKKFSLLSMQEGFKVGRKNIIDLLDEENKYFEKLNKFLEYKYLFIIEYASLKKETGNLDINFLKKLNGYIYE